MDKACELVEKCKGRDSHSEIYKGLKVKIYIDC